MRMRQSNADLQRYYRIANELYFDNVLPKDIPVRFAKLHKGAWGVTRVLNGQLVVRVEIAEQLRTAQSFAIMTLLHEMLHVERPDLEGHDWRFDKRMLRLAKLGALDGLW